MVTQTLAAVQAISDKYGIPYHELIHTIGLTVSEVDDYTDLECVDIDGVEYLYHSDTGNVFDVCTKQCVGKLCPMTGKLIRTIDGMNFEI